MQKLQHVIKNYNSIRSPEAVVTAIKTDSKSVLMRFSGHFCHTCCINDYFDDFVMEAKNNGLVLEIKRIKQTSDDSYVVEFAIKRR